MTDTGEQFPLMCDVRLSDVVAIDGWHYGDAVVMEKLATSLRRHGQLRPLLVRRNESGRGFILVDGRAMYRAMTAMGWTHAHAIDLGSLGIHQAHQIALDMELRSDVDYTALAEAVALLVEAGHTPEALASASPFDAERIRHFATLVSFDWSQFESGSDGQVVMDWGDTEPEQETVHTASPVASTTPSVPVPAPQHSAQAAPPVEAPGEPLPDVSDPSDEKPLALPEPHGSPSGRKPEIQGGLF